LDRLRVQLDVIHVLDTELKRRYAAGASTSPVGITERQVAAYRRRLTAPRARASATGPLSNSPPRLRGWSVTC
jgi:hypothetical protein